MKNFVEDIRDFHRKFGLEYKGKPRMLDLDLARFRIDFMQEELDEYVLATGAQDVVKQLDALVDLLYVVFGTAHMHGFNIEEAWRRVHEANMTKVKVLSKDDARSTRGGSKYDVVKPTTWVAPNLEDLV
jgi:predicted HAD superfamily Cof-like phosphohydrolase